MLDVADVHSLSKSARTLAIKLDDLHNHSVRYGQKYGYISEITRRQSVIRARLHNVLKDMQDNNIAAIANGYNHYYSLNSDNKRVILEKRNEYTRSVYMVKCEQCNKPFSLPADVFSSASIKERKYCSCKCASHGDVENIDSCKYCSIGLE